MSPAGAEIWHNVDRKQRPWFKSYRQADLSLFNLSKVSPLVGADLTVWARWLSLGRAQSPRQARLSCVLHSSVHNHCYEFTHSLHWHRLSSRHNGSFLLSALNRGQVVELEPPLVPSMHKHRCRSSRIQKSPCRECFLESNHSICQLHKIRDCTHTFQTVQRQSGKSSIQVTNLNFKLFISQNK